MIEYVIAHNPDDRVLRRASELLRNGKIVCFPTDTNWILAASSSSKDGIDKLYKIKKESKQKHFSILCSSISMASEVALIDNQAFKALKKAIPGNYTFIFEATKKIAKYIQASKTDKEVGIRFVPSVLVTKLIETFEEPLVSTNIPYESFNLNSEHINEIYSYMLEEKLFGICDMIIDPGEIEFLGISTVIDYSKPTGPEILRQGIADASFLI